MAKDQKSNESEIDLFKRWPIPFEILTEILLTHEDRNDVIAELESIQARLSVIDAGLTRLQRIAAKMSGAPKDAILPDLYIGFVLPDTPREQLAAVAEQCMKQAGRQERQHLIAAWQRDEDE